MKMSFDVPLGMGKMEFSEEGGKNEVRWHGPLPPDIALSIVQWSESKRPSSGMTVNGKSVPEFLEEYLAL